jgi:hypothetical protein
MSQAEIEQFLDKLIPLTDDEIRESVTNQNFNSPLILLPLPRFFFETENWIYIVRHSAKVETFLACLQDFEYTDLTYLRMICKPKSTSFKMTINGIESEMNVLISFLIELRDELQSDEVLNKINQEHFEAEQEFNYLEQLIYKSLEEIPMQDCFYFMLNVTFIDKKLRLHHIHKKLDYFFDQLYKKYQHFSHLFAKIEYDFEKGFCIHFVMLDRQLRESSDSHKFIEEVSQVWQENSEMASNITYLRNNETNVPSISAWNFIDKIKADNKKVHDLLYHLHCLCHQNKQFFDNTSRTLWKYGVRHY